MPKLLRSFCCCVVRPNEKDYKKSDSDNATIVGTNPSSIITQVNKGVNLPSTTDIRQRLKNAKTTQNSKANTNAVTEGQTQSNGDTITITSPMPTDSFIFAANASELADLKQREQFKEDPLLPDRHHTDHGKICLIVDLDETLVHSSFKPVKNADFVIPVEIDNVVHQVYVLKRPYADEFLERVGALFECVLFTASLAKYADPVADLLDKSGTFRSRLFREACVFFEGNYVKDLDRLGRDLNKVVIIDNSPASYAFHPKNALPVRTWFDDPHDCELLNMIPYLEMIANSENIYSTLCIPPYDLPPTIMNQKFLPPLSNTTTTTISTTRHIPQERNILYGVQDNNHNNNNYGDNDYNTTTSTTTIISSSVPNSTGYNYGIITSASSIYTQQQQPNNNNINNTANNKKLFLNNSSSSYSANNRTLENDAKNKRFGSNNNDNIIKNNNNTKDVSALRAPNTPKR